MEAESMDKVISSHVIDDVLVSQIMVPQMRDFKLVEQVKSELIEAINHSAPRAIVIDLCQLEFIGSVGFLAFLAARRATSANQIILCNMDKRIQEVFLICRLISHEGKSDTPFTLQPTVESALASLDAQTRSA
jgi:anti-anti-sigma factor